MRSRRRSGCTACTLAACTGTPGGTAGQASNTFTGDVTIVNAADLAWMKNVVNVAGSVYIDSTALTNVNGLTSLQTIQGDFRIQSNAGLTNVGGLTGLKTVGGFLYVNSNQALTNVAGLSALTSVGGYLHLYNNTALSTLAGLANLTTVGGYLYIQYENALTNLDGLAKLTTIGTATGDQLYIYSNPSLVSITGLIRPTTGKLANLAGNLTVSSNAALSVCQADALKAALAAVGWAKTYNAGSNLVCGSPKACVGAVCQ